MEMVVVPPPWSHFAKPGSICAGLVTQHVLDGGVHKYSLNLWIGCSALDQLGVPRSPEFHIDGERVFEHRRRHQVFPLFAREKTAGHGGEPNIGVKPDLMALMARDEARRQAALTLGGVDMTTEAYREQRTVPWLEHIARDMSLVGMISMITTRPIVVG